MDTMKEALDILKQQIAEEAKKWLNEINKPVIVDSAMEAIEKKAHEAMDLIDTLANTPQNGLLEFFVESGGKIWMSRLSGVKSTSYIALSQDGWNLVSLSPNLKPGAYKFVVMAISQEIPQEAWLGDNAWADGYNRQNFIE